jgi:hypothetical protein
MRDSITIEQSVANVKEASEQNIWLTGKNKGVKIDDITDPDYLQKIIYTLQQREIRAKNIYKIQLSSCNKFYNSIIKRATELDVKLKFNFVPIQDIFMDDDLIKMSTEFEKLFTNDDNIEDNETININR